MPQNILKAGGASDSLACTGGDDGTLLIQTGPSGAKVNALALDASGNGALLGALTQAGIATPRMQLMAVQNTTSGTFKDFTSIPSWVKRITVVLKGVSTNGASPFCIQLGDSGGIETSGYYGGASNQAPTYVANTVGLNTTPANNAASPVSGLATLVLVSGTTWVMQAGTQMEIGNLSTGAGFKTLSTTLDRLRLTTVGGTDTFDLGSINLLLEG